MFARGAAVAAAATATMATAVSFNSRCDSANDVGGRTTKNSTDYDLGFPKDNPVSYQEKNKPVDVKRIVGCSSVISVAQLAEYALTVGKVSRGMGAAVVGVGTSLYSFIYANLLHGRNTANPDDISMGTRVLGTASLGILTGSNFVCNEKGSACFKQRIPLYLGMEFMGIKAQHSVVDYMESTLTEQYNFTPKQVNIAGHTLDRSTDWIVTDMFARRLLCGQGACQERISNVLFKSLGSRRFLLLPFVLGTEIFARVNMEEN
ncbi:hypothetical protein DID76_02170 [Candidatus Marinamargulisbacteria bacterium SCGC AG-414-C22]|nr:hypothetical protein DID76_02170 [Candidatus Marinamargulisbacteria bacterium SCGC AG-414-C22]